MKQPLLSCIFMTCFFYWAGAQNSKDTVLVDFNVKIELAQQLMCADMDLAEVQSYITLPLKLVPLRSEGFHNLIFYSLPDQVLWSVEGENGTIEMKMTPILDPIRAIAISETSGHAFVISWDLCEREKSQIINSYTWCQSRKKRKLVKCIKVEGIEIAEFLERK